MTRTACTETTTSASALTKRELRTLAKRLALSERPELRSVARALDKAIAGEPFGARHHPNDDYDPFRCSDCQSDLWVIYAVAVAFPRLDTPDLALLRGLHGLSGEDVNAVLLDVMCGESVPPSLRYDWLMMLDRQREEIETVRSELEPGCWYRDHGNHWARAWSVPDPDPDPETRDILTRIRADQIKETQAFFLKRSPKKWLAPDPALIQEIRFGSDRRKARALQRKSLRKGFDSSWLL